MPVSVVIVAETGACQKRFKMPTASLGAQQSPLRVLNWAWWAEGEGLGIEPLAAPPDLFPRPLSAATDVPQGFSMMARPPCGFLGWVAVDQSFSGILWVWE